MDVPLASTFMLSTKPGKEAYVEPVIEDGSYRFTVKVGKPKDEAAAKNGTKLAASSFRVPDVAHAYALSIIIRLKAKPDGWAQG